MYIFLGPVKAKANRCVRTQDPGVQDSGRAATHAHKTVRGASTSLPLIVRRRRRCGKQGSSAPGLAPNHSAILLARRRLCCRPRGQFDYPVGLQVSQGANMLHHVEVIHTPQRARRAVTECGSPAQTKRERAGEGMTEGAAAVVVAAQGAPVTGGLVDETASRRCRDRPPLLLSSSVLTIFTKRVPDTTFQTSASPNPRPHLRGDQKASRLAPVSAVSQPQP
ncbi:hypothetical protein PCL_05255 [Purpureocillium lilacinum]|nr:hypothetical protein PCL_05255 [Purpureocillium lilacinum]